MRKSIFRKLLILLLICLVFPLSSQEETEAPEEESDVKTLTHEGYERTYYVHLPEGYDEDREEAYPLLIGLHGSGGTAAEMVFFTGLDELADEEAFIAVFPNGIDAEWSYLDVPWDSEDIVTDDVGFISALMDEAIDAYHVDESRMYVAGFSNGGLMTVRLRCELADRLAAVAAIGATMTFSLSQRCLDADPFPFMIVLGTQDGAFPWSGVLEVENGVMYGSFSLAQTMSFMTSLNFCQGEPNVEQISTAESPVTIVRQAHTQCRDNTEVLLYAMVDRGHEWPSLPVVQLASGDAGSIDQAMWEFFSAHQRSE